MNKLTLVTLIVLCTCCNNSKSPSTTNINCSIHNDSIATIKQMTNTIINHFDSPEFLLECYYKAWRQGNLEQIAACFGSSSTFGFSYNKTRGINYRIVSKEKFQDSIYSHIYKGSYQSEGFWVHPEFFITTEDSIDFKPGHVLYYYWIGKYDGSWIIMGNSSEVESQMQEGEMEASENADRIMDSIKKARSHISN